MGKRKVTVILFPGEEGGYVAFFPLFSSCTTQGETIQEALENARESLELALEVPTDTDLYCLEYSHASHVVIGEIEVEAPVLVSASTGTN